MLSLVMDIRSDVIEATLVDFSGKAPVIPKILYSITTSLPYKNHATGDYLAKRIFKGVEDASRHMSTEIRHHSKEQISSVHYILSTPWALSEANIIKNIYEKDMEISPAVVQKILDDNRKIFADRIGLDCVCIEEKVFSVELNGYAVKDYRSKKAKTLQLACAFTLGSDKIIKRVKAAVTKSIHIEKEYFHSAVLLHYLASRSVITDDKEYTLLHVHGELTEMVVVKKGVTSYLGSFPAGTSTLVRKVSHSLKNSLEATSSLLALYREGKLEESQHAKVEASLQSILKGWHAECMKTFEEMGKDVIVPRLMYLRGDSPHISLFKKILEDSQFKIIVEEGPLSEAYISVIGSMI